ncbi:MAG: dockerin type I repeat-containing protein [Eubacterium sp.]|nr:dockerin type I repeat-containing protein [Eubacterium sp.]
MAGSEDVRNIDSETANGSILINTVGDLNCDKDVTSADATSIMLSAIGATEVTEEMLIVADINGDGKITSADATLVLLAAIGARSLT